MEYNQIKDTHLSNLKRKNETLCSQSSHYREEKMNIDFKGPFRTKTIHGETGFFLFVDQLSGYLRPYLILQNNSATLLACLIDFLQTVVRPTGADWKILHVLDEVLR